MAIRLEPLHEDDPIAVVLSGCHSKVVSWRGNLYCAGGYEGLLRIRDFGHFDATIEVLSLEPTSYVLIHDGRLYCGNDGRVQLVSVFEKTERRVADARVFEVIEE